jgi:O-antigen ligase
MKQQTDMASSQTLTSQLKSMDVTSERVMAGHAALALGICSTFVFIGSAIVSFATSYDQWQGREKLTLMLLGVLLPLALAVLVRRRIETVIGIVGVALGLSAPLIGVAGLTIASVDKGAAAGNLAVLVPLAGCGIVWALTRKYSALLVLLGICLVVATGMIFISGESSAMLGIATGVVVGYGFFWRHRVASPSPWLRVIDVSVLLVGLLSFGVYLLLILTPDRIGQIGQVLPSYYAQRFASWREAPAVIGDYAYTGSGLGAAAMVLSTYLYLVHVPYFHHIHNLFLQVGIEQGLPGMIGLLGMFVAAFWSMAIAVRRAHAYVALCAASVFASLMSLFVSGLFESDVYAGGWVVIMFLSFGFAWVIAQYDVYGRASGRGVPNRPQLADWAIGIIPLVLVAGLFLLPGAQAQMTANQGALAQTKAELSGFVFPLSMIQDEMRRNPRIKLDASIAFYRDALAQNSDNTTALRRLAQIEISRGEYDSARRKLERAYIVAPTDRATRQMLGEVYAVEGRIDDATALWKTIGVATEQLKNRLWWYENIGDQESVDNLRFVLQRLGM